GTRQPKVPIWTWRTWPSPRNDGLGSPVVSLSRLQDSHVATARVLASSKEAFDTPLSQRGLPLQPGPATGRSGAYPGGTCTRWPGPASRTHHWRKDSSRGGNRRVGLRVAYSVRLGSRTLIFLVLVGCAQTV